MSYSRNNFVGLAPGMLADDWAIPHILAAKPFLGDEALFLQVSGCV